MSILIDKDTRVIVQGITGRDGSFHTQHMLDYGTRIVGGVTPGKGGQTVHGVPVFNTAAEAVAATGAQVSVMYVPARFALDAMLDAARSDLEMLVVITEGIPTTDVLRAWRALSGSGKRMLGPNCPGLITPGECKVGIMPGAIHRPGRIGVISRSGTLTYEIVKELTDAGLGQSTCIGIGGDPIIGSRFIDLLPLFEADPGTDAVVLVGEIGGQDEVDAARYFQEHMSKPVVGFMAGVTAPPGRRMGHAGAIVGGEDDTAAAKIRKLEAAGIPVARVISEVATLLPA
ncbi:MAG TPA: succinate--CoA ligase subunit alpha [Candidatus Hydrogenedentes bacterium]|jgi:succinyl-CoA synthetase alpha subunit|nr:succinate--CoA ligase subunit alpha [Candidatus Hydrogenedentota bacterium]MDY0033949.1 succinate--CoA ligase subunit alpha [FCB group bacterium]NLT61392.1 succinate--CoA ligase subunit alpha [Candidatus Hydrogenedentota bacterium]HNV21678.1 succinate--CoA ligase subunit alpha [Candidatus Hydrogenedentota bacterium]HNZ19533.1 succinate--CoA ligase subunit alpha [Candidatus Hydrogenedentota bacterium]